MKRSHALITLLLVIAILAVVNYIVGGLRFGNARLDFTENGLYTLSAGTKKIIEGLNPDAPVIVRLYVTRDTRLMPQGVLNYARRVEDLLLEIAQNSKGKIKLEKIDPRPNTEDEDRAVADDIRGHVVNNEGDKAYFGVVVQCLQQKEVLDLGEETTLEYHVARALAKVSKTTRPVVGVMSAIPLAGPDFNFPAMMQMNQNQPWLLVNQLRLDYNVREVPMNGTPIDSDIEILIVLHPADITPKAEFAIDQYLMRGGKLIVAVDPQSLISERYNSPGQMGRAPSSFVNSNSDLPNLFKAWGINYNKSLVLADMNLRMRMQGRAQPTFLTMGGEYLNRDEMITTLLERVDVFSSGAFSIDKKDGIQAVPLVHSSENSELIDSALAERAREEGLSTFQPTGRKQNVVVRLTGKFRTAFPDGEPEDKAPVENLPKLPGETGGAEQDTGSPQAAPAVEANSEPSKTGEKEEAPAPQPKSEENSTATAKEEAKPAESVATKQSEGAVEKSDTSAASKVDETKKEGDDKATNSDKAQKKATHLTETKGDDAMVFLFADVDMLYEGFYLNPDRSGRLMNYNLPLLLNMVEMLAGGADLIAVRSRGVTAREFDRIKQLNADVEAEYRPLIEQRNQRLNEIVQKIAEMGGVQEKQGMVVLNINQAQRQQLLEEQANLQKEVRDLQKAQNRRKERLEMTITLLNLLGVPALVIAFGVMIALQRRAIRAAR